MRLDILKRKNKNAILFITSIALFLLSYRNCDRMLLVVANYILSHDIISIRREEKLCVNRIFEKYPR